MSPSLLLLTYSTHHALNFPEARRLSNAQYNPTETAAVQFEPCNRAMTDARRDCDEVSILDEEDLGRLCRVAVLSYLLTD